MNERVITRFAPSPTGALHIGGIRTALYNWLYAKKFNGQFILRIEDTDQERSTKESTKLILDAMDWLGLTVDIGPIYQTNRLSRYKQLIEQLLINDKAYLCSCSKERLEKLRASQIASKQKPRYDGHCLDKKLSKDIPHVVRFKNPTTGSVSFTDLVHGNITIDNRELDDLIISRSDSLPTYNFSAAVDDWEMNISHVIRGDDHISNTPRQINILKALGAPIPKFAHLPMILGKAGKRLSKRDGALNILEYKSAGYLPIALLNYLIRLGWSYGDQEIFSIQEMISSFDFNSINRSASVFNNDKLHWLNKHYIKTQPIDTLVKPLQEQLAIYDIISTDIDYLYNIINVQRDRVKTLQEMAINSKYFFTNKIDYDEQAVAKHLNADVLPLLEDTLIKLQSVTIWNPENINIALKEILIKFNLKFPKLAQPLRVICTGSTSSPAIDKTLWLIGKASVLQRMQDGLVKCV